MNDWNGLDFIIFLIFAVNTIAGMSRGAMKEIISMLCLSMALIFTIRFTVPFAGMLNSSPLISDVIDNQMTIHFMQSIGAGPLTAELLRQISFCIALLVCFSGAFYICEAALSYRGFGEMFSFPFAVMNRKVGAALGCTRGFIFNVVLVNMLVLHLFSTSDNQSVKEVILGKSYFVDLLLPSANKLDNLISSQKPESYKDMYDHKDVYNSQEVLKSLNYNQNPLPAAPAENQSPSN